MMPITHALIHEPAMESCLTQQTNDAA